MQRNLKSGENTTLRNLKYIIALGKAQRPITILGSEKDRETATNGVKTDVADLLSRESQSLSQRSQRNQVILVNEAPAKIVKKVKPKANKPLLCQ